MCILFKVSCTPLGAELLTVRSSPPALRYFLLQVVDVTPQTCDNAYAYIPDLGGYGLVVYSWKDNSSWRIKHNFFHFDPLSGNYNVAGINFQWTDGVFALGLSPVRKEDGYRTVYFHPLSSTHEFKVSRWW